MAVAQYAKRNLQLGGIETTADEPHRLRWLQTSTDDGGVNEEQDWI